MEVFSARAEKVFALRATAAVALVCLYKQHACRLSRNFFLLQTSMSAWREMSMGVRVQLLDNFVPTLTGVLIAIVHFSPKKSMERVQVRDSFFCRRLFPSIAQ